jgi:chemotaxis signal transduction protein
VVLLRSKNGESIGLSVDQLGEIPNIPIEKIEMREEVIQENRVLDEIIPAGAGFLALLDRDKILKNLQVQTGTNP